MGDAPLRELGPDDVLVEIAATGLNSADVRILRGDPLLIRLAFGIRRPRTPIPGRDIAGTVLAVGSAVTWLRVGDRVVGEISGGGLAERVVAPAPRLVVVPAGVSFVTAAALPLAGGTAWQALDLAGVAAGDRVLVVGAGGGVGSFTVRLAVLRGARVDAWCGTRARDLVREWGAETVVDYRTADPETVEGGYDAVIDVGGTVPLRALQRLVRDGGLVVGVSGGVNRVFGPLGRMVRGAVLSIGSRRRLRFLAATPKAPITTELLALAARGDLVPYIERTWPLVEADAAVAHVDAGHTVGKVVVVR
ncbi:NAD(P)-dependent alcohol dehydrogenase [Microbacterium sp. TNHR37B]|uniref:NAD(P)-dependent alcohol dehydrogenase n=1 Tax=Microbacterium sp. TNHR37B TaxID=1775956 RepID=UPI0007B1FCA7|nr:NAD(P)-dependent alcohol dehydrogenase [Microbacterium sp. TNHR37B]KZE88509.1 Mycocerosic acid synthase [Microbacterium sp. TNHR37B]